MTDQKRPEKPSLLLVLVLEFLDHGNLVNSKTGLSQRLGKTWSVAG
ncbi:MAG: hypothetical protein JOY96_05290 [Verrucomicrobia bacterium]|nr:hypothetical protein [Verrucomicrobiota bacterium]